MRAALNTRQLFHASPHTRRVYTRRPYLFAYGFPSHIGRLELSVCISLGERDIEVGIILPLHVVEQMQCERRSVGDVASEDGQTRGEKASDLAKEEGESQ